MNSKADPVEDAEVTGSTHQDDLRISGIGTRLHLWTRNPGDVAEPDGPRTTLMTVIGGAGNSSGVQPVWIDKAAPAVLTVEPAEILVGRKPSHHYGEEGGLPIARLRGCR